MKKYQHGGRIYDEKIKLDFSVNINPLGIPQSVKNILINNIDNFCAYPDTNCTRLINKISKHENINVENIVCGNGAADLIYRIVYAAKPKKALLIAPTFSEYEKALTETGCEIEYYMLSEKNNFLPDENILKKLADDIDIFFICNPNNPVGNIIEMDLMKKIADKCRQNNIILAVDECFMDFVADNDKYSMKSYLNENVIILKAFTKIYAMAGLRLGYIICGNSNFAEKIRHTGQCWSVSSPAQLAGIVALDEVEYCHKTIDLINYERKYLYSALIKIGFKVYPSSTNFLLFRSDISLEKSLAEYGIAIRNCDNYNGLDSRYYRISVCLHEKNEILVNALERIIKNG